MKSGVVQGCLLSICAICLALGSACAWDKIDPKAIAPVPGNPCGNIRVQCLDDAGAWNQMCCYEGETCGGGMGSVGCPAGECCNIREIPMFLSHIPNDAGLFTATPSGLEVQRHSQFSPDGGPR